MKDDVNILILSCGTRNKIVQYFKRELLDKGSVIATDCSNLAPALYEADKHYIVPRMDDEGYIDVILSICKENNIKAVLSLIDPELSLLAQHKQSFLDIGTIPIVSGYETIELCFDKYKMYEFLIRSEIQTVKSYIEKEKFYSDVKIGVINYPVFVKPIKGSASINISKVTSKEEIELLFSRFDNLMIQEFMDGTEYGADVYIDMISSEPVAIFIKEKIKMRAGETDKSVSIKDERLFELIKKFVKETGFKGIIDIDIFNVNGEYFISEVNPRFGGGYPHAYESGVNVPSMIINNIDGKVNTNMIGQYDEDIYMMKYNEIKIRKEMKKVGGEL
ncbi:ATP-grasp domain-containing protein [Psychrobacillus lasiicapitis]|uniref:ATP-grasp domain-containing protein n=1 Tax=Psychrobacillus lasiicapitis TaxID=1636719 RepID=A0A544TBR7_9BACI|nr:ATP-grasp domain-containing protein [Psychrobacillus lasiicapitis]TQR14858.1 ATP-grasp domain-containing protein [Psychrobacillus lasiicapitis]GGA20495.1 carbamoyl phosphate synthase [Psychrobacillus lasiicapitis]